MQQKCHTRHTPSFLQIKTTSKEETLYGQSIFHKKEKGFQRERRRSLNQKRSDQKKNSGLSIVSILLSIIIPHISLAHLEGKKSRLFHAKYNNIHKDYQKHRM